MARRHNYLRFVEKANAAMIAAVEIYNKPRFEYREETFSLLAINAWEILLKARILQVEEGDLRRIYQYEMRSTKRGTRGRKKFIKRTISGSPRTISLAECLSQLDRSIDTKVPEAVKTNVLLLSEIRDTAAHYASPSFVLRSQVLRVSAANVKNYVVLARRWFDVDLSNDISLILPLAFLYPSESVETVMVSSFESDLIHYLQRVASEGVSDADCDVAISVEVAMRRSNLEHATRVQIVNDPAATKVVLSEEQMLARFPKSYRDLTAALITRYEDFCPNAAYHALRKKLNEDSRYTWKRHLNPKKPSGAAQCFYSESIFHEFDKHYRRKPSPTKPTGSKS